MTRDSTRREFIFNLWEETTMYLFDEKLKFDMRETFLYIFFFEEKILS